MRVTCILLAAARQKQTFQDIISGGALLICSGLNNWLHNGIIFCHKKHWEEQVGGNSTVLVQSR